MKLKDKLPGDRVLIKGGKMDPEHKWGTMMGFMTNKRGTLFAYVQLDTRDKKSCFRATRTVLQNQVDPKSIKPKKLGDLI